MRGRDSFGDFDATELYCPRCKRSVPVRKRLLLVLANGEKIRLHLCVLRHFSGRQNEYGKRCFHFA